MVADIFWCYELSRDDAKPHFKNFSWELVHIWAAGKQKSQEGEAFLARGEIRRRPTLPRDCPRSTIGAEELNDRVRDGNGCGLLAVATGNSCWPLPTE
jgi:hypothetical protein